MKLNGKFRHIVASAMSTNKEVLINLRVRPEVRDEFKLAAELRGATMSGLLHQFIFRIIREEKIENPEAFEERPQPEVVPSDTEMIHVEHRGEVGRTEGREDKKSKTRR